MNLRQSVELAALVSAHSAHLIESPRSLPDTALHRFWKASQGRLTVWAHELKEAGAALEAADDDDHAEAGESAERLLEDILVSEVLTRVWGGVLTAADRHRGIRHAAPIAENVLRGHGHARTTGLRLLTEGPESLEPRWAAVDRLRRAAERWSDFLIGHLVRRYELDELAFDAERACDFADEVPGPGLAGHNRAWDLLVAGLRLAFPAGNANEPPQSDHRREIAGAILAAFPPDVFQDDGPFQTILQTRIGRSGFPPEDTTPAGYPVQLPASHVRKTGGVPASPSAASGGISFAKLYRHAKGGGAASSHLD